MNLDFTVFFVLGRVQLIGKSHVCNFETKKLCARELETGVFSPSSEGSFRWVSFRRWTPRSWIVAKVNLNVYQSKTVANFCPF